MKEFDKHIYETNLDSERLKQMSSSIDVITLRNLGELSLLPNSKILDIGSGPSKELGLNLTAHGYDYIAVDRNPSFIAEQINNGHNALLGDATNLPLRNKTIDAVNARFVMSWLDDDARARTWEEIFRVGKPDLKGVVTDYNWDVTSGPASYIRLANELMSALKSQGFDPFYGSVLGKEATDAIQNNLTNSSFQTQETTESIPIYSEAEKALLISITASTIIKQFDITGQFDQAKKIKQMLLETLSDDLDTVKLPEVISIRFMIEPKQKNALYPAAYDTGDNVLKHTPLHGVFRVDHDTLIGKEARKLFANIYFSSGYITDEGLDGDLPNEYTDPLEIRNRSELFVVMNGDNVTSTGRLIHSLDNDPLSLPTTSKLITKYGMDILPTDIFDEKAAEISSFVSKAHDAVTTSRLILSIIEHARKHDIKYLIYGAVKGAPDNAFKALFNPTIIPFTFNGENASITVDGPGCVDGGTELNTYIVNTNGFYESVVNYYKGNTSAHAMELSRICYKLISLQERT